MSRDKIELLMSKELFSNSKNSASRTRSSVIASSSAYYRGGSKIVVDDHTNDITFIPSKMVENQLIDYWPL
jgi:hypothetical protein